MAIKRTKEINIFRVMRSIWLNRTTSRIEIARALGLDKSTITNILNDMKSNRLVREVATGEAGPQGGRRPIFLTINKDFGCVLGFEIQPERYTVGVLDMSGEIRYTDTGMLLTSAATLVENFLRILAETRARLPAGLPPIIGVGVGVSGIGNQWQGKRV